MSKPKILLVDDMHLILELEKSFLKYLPVRILTARNGHEAFDIVQRERPNLIYMDLNMPILDGAACCSQIKSDPTLSSIPVILITTAGRAEDEARCRQAGCDDFITKPIDRRVFLERGRSFIPDIDRREIRVNYLSPVTLKHEGEPVLGASADISIGGIYVAFENPIPTDTMVDFSFVLPSSDGKEIAAKGRIAWQNKGDMPVNLLLPQGVGIEFTEIDPDAVSFIKSFVDDTKFDY